MVRKIVKPRLPERDIQVQKAQKAGDKKLKNKFGDPRQGQIRCFCNSGISSVDTKSKEESLGQTTFRRFSSVGDDCNCVVDSGKRVLKTAKLPPSRVLKNVNLVFVDSGDFA